MTLPLPALYPIVDVVTADPAEATVKRALALALAAGGATLVQLRAKSWPSGRLLELACDWREALARHGCALIANDRVDIALVTQAAGVHLGDEDLPAPEARKLLGADAIVGYSTHSLEEVAAAQACGADYLGFGPVYDSPTKAGVREARGTALLARACSTSKLPIVAIGGITLACAAEVFAAGAASCAVISELTASNDPGALVDAYEHVRRRITADASAPDRRD